MVQPHLTVQDRNAFERDGVVCLRGALNASEIAVLSNAINHQLGKVGTSPTGYDFEAIAQQLWQSDGDLDVGAAERFDVQALAAAIHNDPDARPLREPSEGEDGGLFFYDVAGWKQYRGIRQVAFDSALPALIADLLETPVLNFWEDTTFVKTPFTRQKTAFHQDLTYFQIDGDQCAIAWIPVDPANAANGVTRYVRGSHKWRTNYAPNMFVSQTPMPGALDLKCPDIEAHEGDYDIITFDVEPGDVIIHHVRTLHGAGGNRTDRMRRAISFRYCGAEVRYFDRPGAIPQPGIAQPLSNGDRLYSQDYPIVHPKPWPGASLADFYDAEASYQATTPNERGAA